ncbi:hypothetical protein F5Y18DRAFT_346022 [Xylariaceae sp. FL1019]|nr:hypothetical protein F5Y18DRAFT_346022 [Xylariaceae sp. FL1019]
MAATFATPVKSYTWRISAIPRGTTRETLVDFFDIRDRERIEIRSLCPDVLDPEWLTATVLFKPPPGLPEAQPELDSNAPPDIEVDKDFEGFTPLYSPPGGQMIEADIIAVTGFAGHAFGSWARSETFMWLLDLAPRFASSSRILTYGYDIGLLGGRSSAATVTDEAAAFLDHLLNIRDEIEGDR